MLMLPYFKAEFGVVQMIVLPYFKAEFGVVFDACMALLNG